jgi:hypothetical protein
LTWVIDGDRGVEAVDIILHTCEVIRVPHPDDQTVALLRGLTRKIEQKQAERTPECYADDGLRSNAFMNECYRG